MYLCDDIYIYSRICVVLRLNVNILVIAGVNTDICIDMTARRAFTEGYNVLAPKDLIATMNVDGEECFLDEFDRFFGGVIIPEELLDHFSDQKK